MRRNAQLLPFLPLALLVVLVVRALRPLVTIRFGAFPSLLIGAFAIHPEIYLCQRDAGTHDRRAIDIFYYRWPVCNLQLKKMWDRVFHVSQLVSLPDRLNRWLPGGQSHVISSRHFPSRDADGLACDAG